MVPVEGEPQTTPKNIDVTPKQDLDIQDASDAFSGEAHFSGVLTMLTKILVGALVFFVLLPPSVIRKSFEGADIEPKSLGVSENIINSSTTPDAIEICISPDCIITAASILEGLDVSKDPCEDFYGFANGGWLAKNDVSLEEGSFSTFGKVQKENNVIIRRLLESTEVDVGVSPFDYLSLTKLRDLYASCMNETLLNELVDEPLLKVVKVVRDLIRSDSWMTSTQAESRSARNGLTAATAFLHSRGIDVLFQLYVGIDVGADNNNMSMHFSEASFGLPSNESYGWEELRTVYTETLEKIIFMLHDDDSRIQSDVETVWGDNEIMQKLRTLWSWFPFKPKGGENAFYFNKTEHAKQLAAKVVDFEQKIANISAYLHELSHEDNTRLNSPIDFDKFVAELPQINFQMYISTFILRHFPRTLNVASRGYAASLSTILSETEDEVVEAYLVSRTALSLTPYLGTTSEVWKAQQAFEELLKGRVQRLSNRSGWCLQLVEDSMGFATGRFFAQETFGSDNKEQVTRMITGIIEAFKASLKHLSWMDETSANATIKGADILRVKLGYPVSPDTGSALEIQRYYSQVSVDKSTLLENVFSFRMDVASKMWASLGERRDPDAWIMYPSTANAYFESKLNEIGFPAGILRRPFFSKTWPAYLQYGAFGSIAAHELTHAFDPVLRSHNKQDERDPLWSNATREGFDKIKNCIADQYANYTVNDGNGDVVHVDVNLTSSENIADSGIIHSYRAWQKGFSDSLAENREFLLPGLNFSREQLFFLAFGQSFAEVIKPHAAVLRAEVDPHSPSVHRVEGTLRNVPEFAAAFNCPVGSKMNPSKESQCMLWGS